MTSPVAEKKERSMGNEKVENIRKNTRVFAFDPTIHAGHILTMITIIFCSVGAWYDMKSSVSLLKEENVRQDVELERLHSQQKEQTKTLTDNVNALALMNRQDMSKMKDDMNTWFMRINDKLDTKQDKK